MTNGVTGGAESLLQQIAGDWNLSRPQNQQRACHEAMGLNNSTGTWWSCGFLLGAAGWPRAANVSNGTMLRSEQEANSPVLGFQYSLVWGVFKVELQLNSYIFYSSAWESARNFSRKTSLPYSDLRPLHKALRASRLSLQAHGWTPQLNTNSHRP